MCVVCCSSFWTVHIEIRNKKYFAVCIVRTTWIVMQLAFKVIPIKIKSYFFNFSPSLFNLFSYAARYRCCRRRTLWLQSCCTAFLETAVQFTFSFFSFSLLSSMSLLSLSLHMCLSILSSCNFLSHVINYCCLWNELHFAQPSRQ